MPIPFVDFGGEGEEVIHFAHANGFHPLVYKSLLEDSLSRYHVEGILFRPYWNNSNPSHLKSWSDLADDLIQYFDEQGLKNVIGIGHSMGAIVSVLAQAKRSDLFSKLILLEPVVLPTVAYFISMLPFFIKKKLIPVAKISARRRDKWASKEEAFEYLYQKKVYADIPKDIFQVFINYGVKQNEEGGVSLSYSKEWETQIFSTAPNPWKALKVIRIPTLVIRGETTNVISPSTWSRWQNKCPHFDFVEIENGGHLVPLEKYSQVSKLLLEFIE